MEISRRGAAADHGESSISMPSPKFTWHPMKPIMRITSSRVRDFTSDAHHDYAISVSLSDISNILKIVAQAAMKNPELFESELNSNLKDITQLHAVVAGLK